MSARSNYHFWPLYNRYIRCAEFYFKNGIDIPDPRSTEMDKLTFFHYINDIYPIAILRAVKSSLRSLPCYVYIDTNHR